MSTLLSLMFACAPAHGTPLPPAAVPEGFWDHWGDGQAELSGYRLSQPRYGDTRPGQVVLVFVTESFAPGERVKADRTGPGTFPVLKLNEARDFQTGVYDYNVMTSAFMALDGRDPVGVPTKIAFSSQEWCGHLYDQLVVDDASYQRVVHSYFEGESHERLTSPVPPDGLFVDALPLAVRGVTGEVVEPGTQRSIQLHPRLMDLRFSHREARWMDATWAVDAVTSTTTVPAGTFETRTHRFTAGPSTWTYAVEVAPPHRLIAWTGPGGEKGDLTGSMRQPYWKRNGSRDVDARRPLGLPSPAWLAP